MFICNYFSGDAYEVVLGATRYDESESGIISVESTTSIAHSDWDVSQVNNDIRLIKLPNPVDFTSE